MNTNTTRRQVLTAAAASPLLLPTVAMAGSTEAEGLTVATGQTDDRNTGRSGYSVDMLVLDSKDLSPVVGASVEVTLIGPDSGDGGFAAFATNMMGIATINQSLWPGRYQINIKAPQGSNLRDAEFATPETLLVVLKDGSYSPREFRLASK